MYKVIDNFISPRYFQILKEQILESFYNWSYVDNISKYDEEDPGENSLSDFGFNHIILFEEYSSHLHPFMAGFYARLLELSGCDNIKRCRLDMTTYTPQKHKHPPHIDFYYPHISSVFYMTDSDAETVLYNEKAVTKEDLYGTDFSTLTELTRVKPRENRLLIFDGNHLHTGHSPDDCKRRVLINTNLV